jgi:E3 ubiquitin-protein ligase BOI-like protein
MHSKVFLATVEEQVSLLLRGREIELENVTQRNLELEQRIKQIGLETQIWQSKAKSFEAMVAMLRANLQQALLAQSKEQNPIEGHGDNDADDAASEHIDGSDEAQKTRAAVALGRKTGSHLTKPNRACRSCRVVEACVLLVPCMHLCLCSDCQRDVEQCPICNSQRSACVEVYLS